MGHLPSHWLEPWGAALIPPHRDGTVMAICAFPVQGDEAAKAAASRRFQQINEAYTALRDPRRRAAYDRGRV